MQSITRDTEQSQPDPIDIPRDVDQRIGLSSTTRWRLAKAGKFPKAIQLSPGRVGYRRSDIDAWVASRKSGK